MSQVRIQKRTTRSLRRLVALTAAIPLVLVAGPVAGPLVGVAGAVVTPVATNLQVLGNPANSVAYIGPRAGFMKGIDAAHAGDTSINGVTPLVSVTSADAAAVTQVRVSLARQTPTGPAISVFRDFDSSNGFALFKDVAGTGCVTDTFDACDLASGQLSNGISIVPNSPAGTVVLDLGLPSGGVTGNTRYYVAVHPAAANTGDRPIAISLNSFVTTVGSPAFPAAQNVTIDSVAPVPPSRDSFTPVQHAAGTEDAYAVGAAEAGKQLVFFASSTSMTPADVLRHADVDATGVAPPIPPGGGTVTIGDGTGISPAYGDQAAVKVALNRQTSDDVYPRAVDFAGNVSAAANLDAGDGALINATDVLQNDVTAPSFSLTSVALVGPGVNASNAHSVSVKVTMSGVSEAGTARARLIPVDAKGLPPTGPDAAVPTPFGAPVGYGSTATNVSVTVDPYSLPDGSRFALDARAFDSFGNSTVPLYSPRTAGAFTTTYLKDVTPPLTSVAQVDPNGTLTLIFSKPMAVSTLAEGTINTCGPPATNCVRSNITVTAGPTPRVPPCAAAPDFGLGGSFAWSDKSSGPGVIVATRATITLGASPCLVANGDTLHFTTEVQDEAGNSLNPLTKLVQTGQAFPISAVTRDLSGSDGYGMTDGHLDGVDVTFNAAVTKPADADLHVAIRGKNETDVATTSVQLSATVIRFVFAGGLLTAETPFVEAQTGYPGGGVTSANPVVFAAVTAKDGAPPALLSAVTRDLTTPNGKIDQAVLTWSEPINHTASKEAVCGYTVAGYEDRAAPCPGATNPTRASNTIASATGANLTILTLKETMAVSDTGAQPLLTYDPTAGGGGTPGVATGTMPTDLVSPTANVAPGTSISGTVTDGVPPRILKRETRDLDNDGKLDAIDLTYSEDLNSLSLGNAVYTVEGHSVTGVSQTASNHVQLLINELPATGTGDTGALPKVQYVGGADGGLQDANTVPAAPEAAGVASTDGAGPALVAAQQIFTGGTPTQLRVVFSEPVKTSTVDKTDFKVVNGSSGDLDPTGLALAGDRLSGVLTMASPLDHAFDTAVRFKAAAAVTDDAAVANTQTGPVIAPRQITDGTYHAVNPARLLDTSHSSGPLGPNRMITVQVNGRAGIPSSGVRAVVLNLQTSNPSLATYLTAWPTGQDRPSASNLNARAHQTIANLVTVLVAGPSAGSSAGKINLYNKAGSVNLFADVVGYYSRPEGTSGSTYEPIQPARLLNTRSTVGGHLGALGAGQTLTLQATGRGGIPSSGVSAVAVHVTIQSPTAATYLTTYPTNVGRPQVSTVTAAAHQNIADLTLVKLGPTGAFKIYNKAGSAHVLVDVVGYYDAGISLTGSVFQAAAKFTAPNRFISPIRIVNSKTALGRAGALGPGQSFDVTSDNVAGVTPTGVAITGYVMNVQVGSPTATSYFTAWPAGAPRPAISQQNFSPGGDIGTLVQTGVSSGGKASIFNKYGFFDVFVDLSGFFVSAAPTNA